MSSFDVPHEQWMLLNHFHTSQGQCEGNGFLWGQRITDKCECGSIQSLTHTVKHCALIRLKGLSTPQIQQHSHCYKMYPTYKCGQKLHWSLSVSESLLESKTACLSAQPISNGARKLKSTLNTKGNQSCWKRANILPSVVFMWL